MKNSRSNNSHLHASTGPSSPNSLWSALNRFALPIWFAGIIAAITCGGCGAASTDSEPVVSNSNVAVESTTPQTETTPVSLAPQSGELPAPASQQESPGLMGKASKLLNGAKQASGQGAAQTGKWLKGAWDGASDTTGNAVEGSLDWANQTFKSLKDQGLTTASSTGQWLSEDWQNMESWQYKVLAADSVPADQLESKLNELGKQGWECFSVDDQRMIFKKASESYLRRLPFKDVLRLAPLLNQAK